MLGHDAATGPLSHVLIAGAGLGGTALALGLARSGIRSTIYEIRSGPSSAGGSITLASNALRVLDRPIGVYDKLKQVGYTYTRMGAYLDDGYKYGDIMIGDVGSEAGEEGRYPALRIMRTALQQVLLDACEEETKGMVDVKWGVEMQEVKEDEELNKVTVSFTDGTTLTGDILIGADGIHSKVREYVLPDTAPVPQYNGQCTINGFLPSSKVERPPGYPSTFVLFTSSGMLMMVPIDKDASTVAWGITTEAEIRDRAGWKAYETSGQAARDGKAMFAQHHSQPLRSVLDNADETKAKVWPHHVIAELPKWHRGRVCLLGDAAHALPPNGQGTAMAFEDAGFMSRLLVAYAHAEGGQPIDQVFARFEQSRRRAVDEIKRHARPAAVVKGKTGPWAWWAKSWAFWAFFSWHKGQVRFGRDPSYDVMTQSIELE